jgi:P27 family predicted phage terminase small subunit
MGFSLMKGRKSAPVESERPAKRCPPPPSWLPQHAKKEWKRAAKELHGRKLLADDVLATLESYCVAVGQVRECEELMAAEGRIIKTENGPKPHPAFRMQQAAMREGRLHAAELGLTPHRRGVKGGESEDDNGGWDSDLLS